MISVKNISKKYQDILAADNISFELNKGEVIGFLGPNGAGKSTTMKIIAGILRPDKGSVNIFAHDLEQEPVKAKKYIGYLSEDNPLPNEMYVREYLEYVANIYKMTNVRESVEKSIEDFGLKAEYKKKIRTLSKGNRQKLGLAQSLIHNPPFLILDEPISGLDPNQQTEVYELIKDLQKSRIILLSTHILHEIENLVSRIIVINKGKLMIDDKIENIDSVETVFQNITK